MQRTKNRDVRMSTRCPRTSRKTRWTRERSRSRARVRDTCTTLRRLCGVVSHASKFFDSRRREEVTFSGCSPLALSLSLCLSLQRKTHSNRKNGAKSLAQLVQILLLCRLPDLDERAPRSLLSNVLRWVSGRKGGCRRAARSTASLTLVRPEDRRQGIVTARDRVVRPALREVYDENGFLSAVAGLGRACPSGSQRCKGACKMRRVFNTVTRSQAPEAAIVPMRRDCEPSGRRQLQDQAPMDLKTGFVSWDQRFAVLT